MLATKYGLLLGAGLLVAVCAGCPRESAPTTESVVDAGAPEKANVFGPGGLGRGAPGGTGVSGEAVPSPADAGAPGEANVFGTGGLGRGASASDAGAGGGSGAACVDAWIHENGLNEFGDPKDTVYMGGTPLFDERSGRRRDRLDYIAQRHPDIREKCHLTAPAGPADR